MKFSIAIKRVSPIVIFLIVSVSGITGVLADMPEPGKNMYIPEGNPLVRLTGVFHPYSDSLKEGEIVIQVMDKEWIFEVLSLVEVGSREFGGSFRSPGVRSPLRLIGPESQIKPLVEKDINGKTFQFQGKILRGTNIMVLRGEKGAPAPEN